MIAMTDPERKNVYVFADLPTGTVRRLLRTVPGLREWGTAAEQTVQHAPEVRSMPAAFPDTRPAAPAHTTPSTTASTETHEEERVFMTEKTAATGGSAANWAMTAFVAMLALLLGIIVFILLGNWLSGLTGGKPLVTFENRQIEYRIIRPDVSTVITTHPPAATGNTNRLPTPQEVYERQLQSGNVTRTRVPCAEGFFTLPNGNCGRWVQN